jgi:hypothetical protein
MCTLKTRDLRSVLVLAGLAVTLLAAGCSENPPCNTDPSQLDSARTALNDAEGKVDTANADLAEARQKKTNLQKDIDALPDPADLESRLEELKKGSGR